MSTYGDRPSKWDRSARFLKIARILYAHGEAGMSAADLALQVGVSKRTIYRDLEIMDQDAGITIWSDRGKWGLDSDTFLPPLGLTLPEAMAFFLSARLLAKATDELDTEIIGAFLKLGQILPDVLAEQMRETVDTFAHTPRDDSFTHALRLLTDALA
ncbi:MAG: HTH domain-containing protein, partial [Chloroflexota bacterium]|nr:HTH domain-containing protein [Chloroflexota bacterium]